MVSVKRVIDTLKPPVGKQARRRKRAQEKEVREAAWRSTLWSQSDEIATRRYASYTEYVQHQASKLDTVADTLRRDEPRDFALFVNGFKGCTPLAEARSVLCLGARLGTEVKALHSLGYFAIGVDLNPGPDNRHVLPGDFHNLVFPDNSVDAIYTNALDHVYDLNKVVGEVKRVLRPNGLFVADLIAGFEEGFVPGAFEAMHWPCVDRFVETLRSMSGFSLVDARSLGRVRQNVYVQAVLRKPA